MANTDNRHLHQLPSLYTLLPGLAPASHYFSNNISADRPFQPLSTRPPLPPPPSPSPANHDRIQHDPAPKGKRKDERGSRARLIPCIGCDSVFDRPSALRMHMLSHTGEKPHICSKCQRRFSVVSNMKRHYKTCGLGKRSIHHSTMSKPHVQPYPLQSLDGVDLSRGNIDRGPFSLPPILVSPSTAVYPSTSTLASITSQRGMSWSAPSTSLARLSQPSTPYSSNHSPYDEDDHPSHSSNSISPASYISSPDNDRNPYIGYANTINHSQGHSSYVPPAPRIVYSDGTIAPSLSSLPPLRSQIDMLIPSHSHHNRIQTPIHTHPSTSSYSTPTPIVITSPSRTSSADASPVDSLPPSSSLSQDSHSPIDHNNSEDERSPQPHPHPFSGRYHGTTSPPSPPPLPAHLQQRRSVSISNPAFPAPTLISPQHHPQHPLHPHQDISSLTPPVPAPPPVVPHKSKSAKPKTAKQQAQAPRTRRRWIPLSLSHFKNADTLSSSGPFKYAPSGGPGTSTITVPLQPVKPRGRPIPLGGAGAVGGSSHGAQPHDDSIRREDKAEEEEEGEEWEERDSYDTTVPREPYHSKSWRERLPGPSLLPADEFIKDARRARKWVLLT